MPFTELEGLDLGVIRAAVMDMDGVLWRGDQPLPGAQDIFTFLRAHDIGFVLASNNSTRSPAMYVTKLAGLGIEDVLESQIVTSGTTTVDHLHIHYPPSTRIHVLGGEGLKRMVADAGFPLVDDGAQVVVVGIDFELTYEKLKRAALQIRAGADFIGTNDDVTFPSPEGLIPGAGSVLAGLAAAVERPPLVMGKPGQAMYQAALRVLGTDAAQTLMIGDRLNTDIAGANVAGLRTALVLTGVSTLAEVEASQIKPNAVFEGLPALMAAWETGPQRAKQDYSS